MKNIIYQNFIIKILFIGFFFSLQLFSLPTETVNKQTSFLKQQYFEFFNQGNNFKLQGNYEKAINSFEKSFTIANRITDKENRINSLNKLGILYWNVGNLKKSTDVYREALTLAEKINLKNKKKEILDCLEIYNLYREGKGFRSQGEHQKSIESFDKAIALARKIRSEEHEVKCLRQQSITYLELNNLNKFFSLNKQALDNARKLNHRKEEGRCLINIGIYYQKLENYSRALKCYQDALQIARDSKNIIDQSICITNISNVYNYIGNYDKALEYMKDALRIDKQLNDDSYISMDLNNIGEIYRSKGLHSNNRDAFYKALEYFKNSMELARKNEDEKTEIRAVNNIGTVYTDLKNYLEAQKYFKQGLKKAEELQDVEATGMLLNNIGIVYYNQGNYELSTNYYQKAIDLALSIKGGQILWEAYFEMANAYKRQKNYKKALEYYKNSISVIEDIRSKIKLEELKASYLGTDKRIEAYHNMIDLLVKLHQSNPEKAYNFEAFNYLERAKARSFLDSLEVSEVSISQGINLELLNQEKELMKEISKIYQKLLTMGLNQEQKNNLYEQLKTYEDKIETVQREIRITSPAYANLKYPQIISLKEAQKKFTDNETAIFEYCVGKENSYAFVITKKELKIFKIPPSKKIQRIVQNHLRAITDKECKDFQLGYELFSTLILPGLDKNIRKLIFSPDDILHFLPFETLISHKDMKKWLIEDYKISYIPSLTSLREIIQHRKMKRIKPRKDLLAFGDPFFGTYETEDNGDSAFQNFYRLKYSGLEIDGIASLFKKTKRDIFKREKATEERVKELNLSDYKILHLATHGLIDDKKPARSSIILSLSNSNPEDGFLQTREIFNLKLNCDLVTLSACQTGLGKFIKGEGIEGLNRAFFYAGASSSLISLWAVNDQASAQLMKRFYTHLRSSYSIMNALRKAKLEMIASDALSHPYYWAGFIITGKADKTIFLSPLKKLILLISILLIGGGITALKGFSRNS